MLRILRIETATAGRDAPARALTNHILARETAAHPGATVRLRDLTGGLVPVTAAWRAAVALTPEARDDDQRSLLSLSDRLRDEAQAADLLLIGVEVQTMGLPAPLKSWIDHLARGGEGLADPATGRAGCLAGKRAILAVAGEHGPVEHGLVEHGPVTAQTDFATPYLRHMLAQLGLTQVELATDLAALRQTLAA